MVGVKVGRDGCLVDGEIEIVGDIVGNLRSKILARLKRVKLPNPVTGSHPADV